MYYVQIPKPHTSVSFQRKYKLTTFHGYNKRRYIFFCGFPQQKSCPPNITNNTIILLLLKSLRSKTTCLGSRLVLLESFYYNIHRQILKKCNFIFKNTIS